jgi:hypothetical protein
MPHLQELSNQSRSEALCDVSEQRWFLHSEVVRPVIASDRVPFFT